MAQGAARTGDDFSCPTLEPGQPPIQHVGGKLTATQQSVRTNNNPLVRVGDTAICSGATPTFFYDANAVNSGSATVFIEGKPAARQGDAMKHRRPSGQPGIITSGSDNLRIGG